MPPKLKPEFYKQEQRATARSRKDMFASNDMVKILSAEKTKAIRHIEDRVKQSGYLRKDVDPEDLEERQLERLEFSIEQVVEEIQKKKTEFKKPAKRERLRRLGSTFIVALCDHTRPNPDGEPTRKLAVLKDSMKFTDLKAWVAARLGHPKDKAEQLVLQGFDKKNRSSLIQNQTTLNDWLDESWTRHPMQLHALTNAQLLAENMAQSDHIAELFSQYDVSGDGRLDLEEVLGIMKEVTHGLNLDSVGTSELAAYSHAEFALADSNGNGKIDFEEFAVWFNEMRDFFNFQNTRASRIYLTALRAKAEFVEAASARRTLGDIEKELGSTLLLDAKGHDYGITVKFNEGCVTEGNRGHHVHAQTLLDEKVDHFQDETHCSIIGKYFSPIFLLETEEAETGELMQGEVSVTMPHCFAPGTPKEDVLVCFSTFETQIWREVDSSFFQLLHEPRVIIIRMVCEGIVCAFSKSNLHQKMLMQCIAYLPEKMIPLEGEALRVHVVKCLPDVIEELNYVEASQRGDVLKAGQTEPIEVIPGDTVLDIELQNGGEKVHKDMLCDGEYQFEDRQGIIEFSFTPVDKSSIVENQKEHVRKVRCSCFNRHDMVRDAAQLGMERARELAAHRATSGGGAHYDFDLVEHVHDFPPPSPPRDLNLKLRTNTYIEFMWDLPATWGGCALMAYELRMRVISNQGERDEWEIIWRSNASKPEGGVPRNIYACEVQVRAYNVAEEAASEWSEMLFVGPEEQEKAAKLIQNNARRNHAKLEAATRRKSMGNLAGESHTEKVAVVYQEDLNANYDDSGWRSSSCQPKQNKSMAGWSAFAQTIGEFFIEAGVEKGARGKLFDLTVQQVEDLANDNAMDALGVTKNKPLCVLAVAGTWTMETLAHWTDKPEVWIPLLNALDGLVNQAVGQRIADDTETESHVKGLLFALQEVYETMRQSGEGGMVTKQLQFKYDKKTTKNLKQEHTTYLKELSGEVGRCVMQLLLYRRDAYVGHGEDARPPLKARASNLRGSYYGDFISSQLDS